MEVVWVHFLVETIPMRGHNIRFLKNKETYPYIISVIPSYQGMHRGGGGAFGKIRRVIQLNYLTERNN